jgi:hypothetical protein
MSDYNDLDNFFACDPELIRAYRQRRYSCETDQQGCITWAEITRMTTGPEPGTYRLRRTPDSDPWYIRPRCQNGGAPDPAASLPTLDSGSVSLAGPGTESDGAS